MAKVFYDVLLAELSYWYLIKHRKELTTGNLFMVMEKICKQLDLKNKNTKNKLINFKNGHCEMME